MGYSLDFGPPNDALSPGDVASNPASWEAWKGTRRLSREEMDALVAWVHSQGFTTSEQEGRIEVAGDFESFCFACDGGWLSKPSADAREYARQWDTLTGLCDRAGWVIYDPQVGALIYGPDFRLEEVTSETDLIDGAIAAVRRGDADLLESVKTLRRYGENEPPTLFALAEAMEQRCDVEVRREAAAGIQDAGRHAVVVVDALERALRDPDGQVRAFAAQALGQLGYAARSALPTLHELARDDEYGPNRAAQAAIQHIEAAPEPSSHTSSKPSATEDGEFIDATVIFVGPTLVLVRASQGGNINLRLTDSGVSRGDVIQVSVAPTGKARAAILPSGRLIEFSEPATR